MMMMTMMIDDDNDGDDGDDGDDDNDDDDYDDDKVTMTMRTMMMRLRVIQLNEGMKMQTSHLWNRKFGSGRGITSIDLNQIPNLN